MTDKEKDFISLYCEYCQEITDASPDYHQFMAMGAIGVALKNKVFMPWGDTKLFPNFWIIVIGESTLDRKTTAIMLTKRLIDRFDHTLIYDNEFSYEGLVKLLAARPTGGFWFSEFKTLMGLLNRDYMQGARGFLADMFDSPYEYRRKLSNDTFSIDHPAVSMFAATTQAWFVDQLKAADVEAGLIPRFIIVPSVRHGPDVPLPPMADKQKQATLIAWLHVFAGISGPIYLTPDAQDMHNAWYQRLRIKISRGKAEFAPFAGRLQAYLIKFCIVNEVNTSQTLKVTAATMKKSIDQVDWLYTQMSGIEADVMQFGKTNRDIGRIKKIMISKPDLPDGWITRTQLTRLSHMTKWEIDQVVINLQERDEVMIETVKDQSKRPIQKLKLK